MMNYDQDLSTMTTAKDRSTEAPGAQEIVIIGPPELTAGIVHGLAQRFLTQVVCLAPEEIESLTSKIPRGILIISEGSPSSRPEEIGSKVREIVGAHRGIGYLITKDGAPPCLSPRLGPSLLLREPLSSTSFGNFYQWLHVLESLGNATLGICAPDLQLANQLGERLQGFWQGVHLFTAQEGDHLIESLEILRPDLLVFQEDLGEEKLLSLLSYLQASPGWQSMPTLVLRETMNSTFRRDLYDAGVDLVIDPQRETAELEILIEAKIRKARYLRLRADRDPLTGLLTRRAFVEQVTVQLSSAHRYGHPLSLALLDLDLFKQVNDTFGHQAGDQVLRTLGRVLQQSFRTEDLCARWGGEEFIIALYGVDEQGALRALVRARETLRSQKFSGPEGGPFSITFSAGIGSLSIIEHDLESLLRQADKRLLRAKEEGRNRIITSG